MRSILLSSIGSKIKLEFVEKLHFIEKNLSEGNTYLFYRKGILNLCECFILPVM